MLPLDIPQLCGYEKDEQTLCGIYCREPVPAQALSEWFDSVDFEALPPEITCMASAAGAVCDFSGVPENQIPRLRGIIKYVHTLNSGMMAGVCLIGAALGKAGIDVLLLEDTAVYMSCPDAPQRHLWQTRIGVRRRDFDRALEIIRELGFQVEKYVYAAAARQGVTRQVSVLSLEDSSWLWCDAVQLKRGIVTFLCPGIAATFISVNQSAFRALTKRSPRTAMVRWCMDLKILTDRMSEADWLRAAQIAKNEHAKSHIRLMLELYTQLSGNDELSKRLTLFGSDADVRKLPELLLAFRRLPEQGSRICRGYLRCRLRRPDSLWQSLWLFVKEAAKKVT